MLAHQNGYRLPDEAASGVRQQDKLRYAEEPPTVFQ
jgi:hypothetical protein